MSLAVGLMPNCAYKASAYRSGFGCFHFIPHCGQAWTGRGLLFTTVQMGPSDLLPRKDDIMVIQFCRDLCGDSLPIYVLVHPDTDFLPVQCFQNVATKINRTGGEIVYGWEVSQYPRVYLEARHHAIWKSPSGQLIDVTPEEFGMRRILFLPDPGLSRSQQENPRRRFPLSKDVRLVERYWALLDESLSLRQSAALGGVSVNTPAIQFHLQSLQIEMQIVRQSLEKI